MTKKNNVILSVVIIVVAAAVIAINYTNSNRMSSENLSQQSSFINNSDVINQDNDSGDRVLASGVYEEYSAEKIARAADGPVVIFFHASWCPSCRTLSGNIDKNISNIPSGLTILKANYDKEDDLKKKYGVTSQHTLVQVDENGNMIKKWSGGSKLENLISQID